MNPSIGVNQVSNAMKRLNATWMLATSQECAFAMGATKKVQPYWRLAIIIMQMTPTISCIHRKPLDMPWPGALASVAVIGAVSHMHAFLASPIGGRVLLKQFWYIIFHSARPISSQRLLIAYPFC